MKVVFVLDGNLMSEIPNCGYGKAVMMDQEARVLRYKEKRKNRRFEKTIHGSLFFQFLHSHSNEDPPSTITLVLAGSSSLLFTDSTIQLSKAPEQLTLSTSDDSLNRNGLHKLVGKFGGLKFDLLSDISRHYQVFYTERGLPSWRKAS
ncbi:unnamed protein product [Trifolium pratense]|uniref:Uncharacterized protein n=1 Tax=Trifolium pratense TaxID=57577 RepID=A0ACB0J5D9_TRIPR|nr:unnamed protein product [Trifolium pratense]